jgi:hypothetical protein
MSRAIKKYQISVFVLFSLFFANGAFGQVTEVTGKVFDASDGSDRKSVV